MSEHTPHAGPELVDVAATEFERELRVRLAEAEVTAVRAEADGEHDLADAMRAHADDLRRTATLHAVPTQAGEVADLSYDDDRIASA